jgi:hypothetical protein
LGTKVGRADRSLAQTIAQLDSPFFRQEPILLANFSGDRSVKTLAIGMWIELFVRECGAVVFFLHRPLGFGLLIRRASERARRGRRSSLVPLVILTRRVGQRVLNRVLEEWPSPFFETAVTLFWVSCPLFDRLKRGMVVTL